VFDGGGPLGRKEETYSTPDSRGGLGATWVEKKGLEELEERECGGKEGLEDKEGRRREVEVCFRFVPVMFV